MTPSDLPIGIFDSGVGGLTVLAKIVEHLPGEDTIYLGDTARVPYGTKSPETVVRYARCCADYLLERGVKALVVACNTASSYAVDVLMENLPVPVLGVIDPGARAAVRATHSRRIGVIGTPATVASGAYERAIWSLCPEAEIFLEPCPLFVPLAEEGWTEGEVPRLVANRYLHPLKAAEIDVLVLGCTHYPLLRRTIAEVMGDGVRLVDSATETAHRLAALLEERGLRRAASRETHHSFLITDAPEPFVRVGKHFWSNGFENLEWVDIS